MSCIIFFLLLTNIQNNLREDTAPLLFCSAHYHPPLLAQTCQILLKHPVVLPLERHVRHCQRHAQQHTRILKAEGNRPHPEAEVHGWCQWTKAMVPEAGTGKSTPQGHTLSRPESPNAHTPPEGRRERYFNI